jgi:hypothetical protein
MKTYDIYYDTKNLYVKFKVGDDWFVNLSNGDIDRPLSESFNLGVIKLTLPTTCRTNEDFYNLYPEYLI